MQRRREAFKDDDPLCARCRRKAWTQLDHIVPLSKGGEDVDENLQGLCDDCHAEKTAEDMGYRDASCDQHGNPLAAGHHWNNDD